MVLQLEELTDILKAIHTSIDFIFLLDHPYGNDIRREYSFNVTQMNSGYGRAQQEMQPENIKHEVGYLGPHDRIIEVGDDKNMVFQEGSDVPFWMTPQDHIDKTFSWYDDTQLRYNTKDYLISHLKSAGVDISVVKG